MNQQEFIEKAKPYINEHYIREFEAYLKQDIETEEEYIKDGCRVDDDYKALHAEIEKRYDVVICNFSDSPCTFDIVFDFSEVDVEKYVNDFDELVNPEKTIDWENRKYFNHKIGKIYEQEDNEDVIKFQVLLILVRINTMGEICEKI